MQCSAVQYSLLHNYTELPCIVRKCTAHHCTALLHCTVLHVTVLHQCTWPVRIDLPTSPHPQVVTDTAPHSAALCMLHYAAHCIALYCTALYCAVLHCTLYIATVHCPVEEATGAADFRTVGTRCRDVVGKANIQIGK